MKKLLIVLSGSLLLMLFLGGCKKDDPFPIVQEIEPGHINFRTGEESIDDTANAHLNKVENTIVITSTFSPTPGVYNRLILTVNGTTTGDYTTNAAQSISQIKYIYNGVEYLSTNSTIGGMIKITSLDTLTWHVSGSFSGELKDSNGNTITISSGQFSTIEYFEPEGGGGTSTIVRTLNAEKNSVLFSPSSVQAHVDEGVLYISAYKDNSSLFLKFPLSKPGTYAISAGSGFTAEYNDSGTVHSAESGNITINSHDFIHNTISATFSFSTGSGLNITNGTFTVVY